VSTVVPISRRLAAAMLLGALGACAGPASRPTGPARAVAPFTPETALALVNAYRAEHGVPPLRLDPALASAAASHSRAMLAAGRMGHDVGTEFTARLAAHGVVGRAAAENVAYGQRSLAEVMEGWKRSPGHAANMRLAGVSRMGIAEAGSYWTLVLAGE
jgi:uncharacterized protein YkwD